MKWNLLSNMFSTFIFLSPELWWLFESTALPFSECTILCRILCCEPVHCYHCTVMSLVHAKILLLLQISPEDIQWVGEDPGINHGGGRHGSGNGMSRSVGRSSVPGAVRGRGTTKGQSKMDFFPSQNGIGKKTVDDIHILHTDTLVKKVTENTSIRKVLFEII